MEDEMEHHTEMSIDQQKKDKKYMRQALTQAKKAAALMEVPIGCVIVYENRVIARGYNRRNTDKNTISHAEMNAIISAARRDTLGATLYLAGREAKDGQPLHNATSCSMCRRVIINAGIQQVVIRNGKPEYSIVNVEDWVREDDSLPQIP